MSNLRDGPSDVLLVNQTADTLQNLCLDFATLGDLKLVERLLERGRDAVVVVIGEFCRKKDILTRDSGLSDRLADLRFVGISGCLETSYQGRRCGVYSEETLTVSMCLYPICRYNDKSADA